jgi:DNA replication protein DnaC
VSGNPRAATTADAVAVVEPMSGPQAQQYQRPRAHLSELRMSAAAESLTAVLDAARDEDLSPVTVLERLLGIEVAAAQTRRHTGLLRFASLPAPYRDRGLRLRRAARVEDKLIRERASLRFLNDAGNVLLVGQPGTGEDNDRHRTCASRDRSGASGLLHYRRRPGQTLQARRFGGTMGDRDAVFLRPATARHRRVRHARHNPDPEANTALFEVISRRYLKSSTIVTSHAGVASWDERLADPMLAASLLDRLLHRGAAAPAPSARQTSRRFAGWGTTCWR